MAQHNPDAQCPTYVLALDLGSTNLKAALYRSDSGCVGKSELPVHYTARGVMKDGLYRAELDPGHVWEVAVAAIRTICRHAAVATDDIDRISVASQAQTFVLLDENEKPLTPFYSWLDCRGAPYLAEIESRLGADFHRHCSFASGMAEMQLSKLLWLHRTAPDVLASARHVLQLPSYVLMRLAGLSVLDPNLAGMSGLYSLRQGRWWDAALDTCAASAGQLPLIVPLGEPVGATRRCPELRTSPSLEVAVAGNDHTAGAYGNDVREGDVIVTLGTALVAYHIVGDSPGPYSPAACWGPYPGDRFYELAVSNYGCLALDWAVSELVPDGNVETFIDLAQSTLGQGTQPGDAAQPASFFYPSRIGTPEAWLGSADVPRRALAVLEGIGFALHGLIANDLSISPGTGRITVVGGGSRSAAWRRILAGILACPITVGTGDARTGAARMAIQDVPGFTLGDGDVGAADQTVSPEADAVHHYRRLYRQWLESAPTPA